MPAQPGKSHTDILRMKFRASRSMKVEPQPGQLLLDFNEMPESLNR
jgi:hypothetical protein